MATKQQTISTKLQFEGEQEYKQKVSEINSSLYNLGQELKLTTAHFADNAKSTEALTAKQEVLQRTYEQQKAKVAEMEKALAALNAQENVNEAAVKKQEEALMAAKIAMEKTGSSLRTVENQLAEASKESGKFSKELKENATQATDTKNKFSDLGAALGSLGKAFGTAMAAIGTAAAAAGTAMAAFTISASNTADELLTNSQITRQSTEDLQKYSYACKFVDVEVNTLTASLIKNVRSMDSARNGTGSAAAAYEALGIAVTNADGSLRDSNEVYWETIDALKQVENETERDSLAMNIFGKSATELNTLINAGSAAFKAYGEEAEKMGIIMHEEEVTALGAFNDKIQQLTSSLGGLKNAAALVALPFLDDLTGSGTNILAEFTNGIREANGDITKMGDVIGVTLGNIVSLVMAKLPELVEMGVNIVKAIVESIADNAEMLVNAAIEIINTLVDALQTTLPILLKGAVTVIKGLAQGISQQLPTLIPVVVEMILTLVQGIAENLPTITDSAMMIIEALVDGIVNALPILVDMLPTIIITIVDGIIDGLPKIFSSAARIITALINGILNALPDLVVAIPTIIIAIVNGILTGLPDIIASGAEIINALVTGITSAIPQLIAAVPQIIFGIVDAFASGEINFIEIGVNIVKGIWEGIKSMFSTLWDNIKGFFGGIIDGVKGFLGIHSPSTVFAGIGGNMAQGIGVGFAEEMQKVSNEIKSSIPTEFDVESEINLVAAPISSTRPKQTLEELAEQEENKTTAIGGGIVQVTQNIYTPQYNYAEQQREAVQQLRQLARQV